MPWCAIFLCSQCWSHSANFLHQERHCGAAGTDQVSTRAAALCPALWFLDSHSRPSAPSTSLGPATNPSLLSSNLCKLALVHMIMYCRVGSSPRRSCSASSKSPEGLLLCPKAAIGQSNRQVSQHDCTGSSSGCCLPYLSLLSLVRQTFVFVHSRILRFCGYVLVATAFSR